MQPGTLGVLSARRSLTLLISFVVCLAIWQVRLTWRLMDQDRRLQDQHSRERLEQVSDLTLARLAREVGNWELVLREISSLAADRSKFTVAAVLISLSSEKIAVFPKEPLLFVPEAQVESAPPSRVFQTADDLELRKQQYEPAMAALEPLLKDSATRPEALLRVARLQRKSNRLQAALMSYKQLEAEPGISSSGVPYALMALIARCRILAETGAVNARAEEAARVRTGLLDGRWPLRREAFEYYWGELRRFDASVGEPPESSLQLSVLISELHERWLGAVRDGSMVKGRSLMPDSRLLLWNATPARLTALVTRADWLAAGVELPPDIRWRLNPKGPNGPGHVSRSLSDLGLPGRIEFFNEPAAQNSPAHRSRLWLAGVGLMLMLVLASGYAVHRAISHELRVARLQSDFVAAVSHEFRSPLTTLRTITELLANNRITDELRRQKSYTFLDHETKRLHRLVEDLLDFGRMESGRKQYHFESYDAFQLTRGIIADFSEEAAAKGFQLEISLAQGTANIHTDEEAFRRAIRNLLENAVKYSPACRTVWVDGAADGEHVFISVRDRGLGIPLSEQRQIFQKFVRGATAKKAGIKGTGIGLSMVQQIARSFGGEVQVESKVGAGSTFTLVLPLAAD